AHRPPAGVRGHRRDRGGAVRRDHAHRHPRRRGRRVVAGAPVRCYRRRTHGVQLPPPGLAGVSGRRSRATVLRRRARRRRERRRMLRIAAITASVALGLAGVFVVVGMLTVPHPDVAGCAAEPQASPAAGVGGWRGEQLETAAGIVGTARQLGFDRDGQIIGVMAAMGESWLRNIDYGDWETSGITNPDGSRTSSIGLFQQQSWWGTVAERMDPATAATKFFTRLGRIPEWREMPPSHAINRVQVNSDREHYARFQDDAAEVVDALSGE